MAYNWIQNQEILDRTRQNKRKAQNDLLMQERELEQLGYNKDGSIREGSQLWLQRKAEESRANQIAIHENQMNQRVQRQSELENLLQEQGNTLQLLEQDYRALQNKNAKQGLEGTFRDIYAGYVAPASGLNKYINSDPYIKEQFKNAGINEVIGANFNDQEQIQALERYFPSLLQPAMYDSIEKQKALQNTLVFIRNENGELLPMDIDSMAGMLTGDSIPQGLRNQAYDRVKEEYLGASGNPTNQSQKRENGKVSSGAMGKGEQGVQEGLKGSSKAIPSSGNENQQVNPSIQSGGAGLQQGDTPQPAEGIRGESGSTAGGDEGSGYPRTARESAETARYGRATRSSLLETYPMASRLDLASLEEIERIAMGQKSGSAVDKEQEEAMKATYENLNAPLVEEEKNRATRAVEQQKRVEHLDSLALDESKLAIEQEKVKIAKEQNALKKAEFQYSVSTGGVGGGGKAQRPKEILEDMKAGDEISTRNSIQQFENRYLYGENSANPRAVAKTLFHLDADIKPSGKTKTAQEKAQDTRVANKYRNDLRKMREIIVTDAGFDKDQANRFEAEFNNFVFGQSMFKDQADFDRALEKKASTMVRTAEGLSREYGSGFNKAMKNIGTWFGIESLTEEQRRALTGISAITANAIRELSGMAVSAGEFKISENHLALLTGQLNKTELQNMNTILHMFKQQIADLTKQYGSIDRAALYNPSVANLEEVVTVFERHLRNKYGVR